MSKFIPVLASCALCLLVAQPGYAVVAVAMARGTIQSVSVSGARVTIAGKSYAVDRSTIIVGAKSLGQIPRGASVTAILSPDGRTVMRLIVQRPAAAQQARH